MAFASEQERQDWIAQENKRVAASNAATLRDSAAAVDKHREESEAQRAEQPEEPAPRLRRGPRPAEGTLVSPPDTGDEGDEVDLDDLAAPDPVDED